MNASPFSSRTSCALLAVGLMAATTQAQTSLTIAGPSAGSEFGRSVSKINDISGDNLPDFIVGAPGAIDPSTGQQVGGVYVYNGATGGVVNLTGNGPLGGIHGSNLSAAFGSSVASPGDLDGDSFGEIVVGDPFNNLANVYMGKGGGFIRNLTVPTVGNWVAGQPGPFAITPNQFGFCVANAGDVNADGVNDIIVGGPSTTVFNWQTQVNNSGAGMIVIYDGLTGANIMQVASASRFNGLYGQSLDQNFGWSVGTVGDWDGDGFDDVFATSPNDGTGFGKVTVYSGQWISTINVASPPTVPLELAEFYGSTSSAYLGLDAEPTGDLDGDGVQDLLVGGYDDSFAFSSTSTMGSPVVIHTIANLQPGDYQYIAGGEDLDADGTDDIVVGPWTVDPTQKTKKASAYDGSSGAFLFHPTAPIRAGNVFDIALIADTSGNSNAEVVMGFPNATIGGLVLGQVTLYLQ